MNLANKREEGHRQPRGPPEPTHAPPPYLAARAVSRRRIFFLSAVANMPTTLATLISFTSLTRVAASAAVRALLAGGRGARGGFPAPRLAATWNLPIACAATLSFFRPALLAALSLSRVAWPEPDATTSPSDWSFSRAALTRCLAGGSGSSSSRPLFSRLSRPVRRPASVVPCVLYLR